MLQVEGGYESIKSLPQDMGGAIHAIISYAIEWFV
jgi:hypothetical protein